MLPKQMGFRALMLAKGIFAPLLIACPLATNASADLITIDKLHQESRLQGNIHDQNGGQQGYSRIFHNNASNETLVNLSDNSTASVTSPTGRAVAAASQTASNYLLSRSSSMLLDFSGSTSGLLENARGTGDSAAVFDFFCVSFSTASDMNLSLTANTSVSGNTLPFAIKDGNNNDRTIYFALKSTGAANGFQDIEIYDSDSFQTAAGAMLPAGSYHLVFRSEYKVGDSNNVVGQSYSGGTSYGVNMSISAVPEPSAVCGLLLGAVCVGVRRKRSHFRL